MTQKSPRCIGHLGDLVVGQLIDLAIGQMSNMGGYQWTR